ncbi:hypothetical protein [Sulfurisphaera ohwakuensis]|nr:hypothetical protein [Sulfurisphaera ohwakuensis]
MIKSNKKNIMDYAGILMDIRKSD